MYRIAFLFIDAAGGVFAAAATERVLGRCAIRAFYLKRLPEGVAINEWDQ
jgi:hypothetical protein